MDYSKLARDSAIPVETVLPITATVEESMTTLRQKHIAQKIIYFYVVDENYRLRGVVSTRQLILAEPNVRIEDIMQPHVVKLHCDQTLQQAMELFAEHPLLALPVIDDEGRLMGTIDVQMVMEEVVDIADMRTRLDVFQMIGLSIEDGKKVSMRKNYRRRMPWLLCNVFSGLMCAVISRSFEGVLSKYLLLAFFIPLVLTLSESTSMQSMTNSILFLRRPRFHWSIAFKRGMREWQLDALLGCSSGLLVGFFSLFWDGGLLPSLSISMGILASVIFSAFFGITIPVVLHRLKLDPKVAAGPLVLMITDILTTALYLGVATWWLL
ncbi:MAG: magnesium transporter [Verrucomicrobiota bacterium]|nr:magnesium transporter [Verrucomicrobiota bacterium]